MMQNFWLPLQIVMRHEKYCRRIIHLFCILQYSVPAKILWCVFFLEIPADIDIFNKIFNEHQIAQLRGLRGVKDTIAQQLLFVPSHLFLSFLMHCTWREVFPTRFSLFPHLLVFHSYMHCTMGTQHGLYFQDPFIMYTLVVFRAGVGYISHSPRIIFLSLIVQC
jgi:hypothetical protein